MPTFYDLMKFAATGIASPDMTAFDKARALAAFGGGKTQTLTDIPPLSFKANGKPLISWSMLGNGQQTGTPSPDNIIMPTFCGVRTANLWDEDYTGANINAIYRSVFVGDGTFTLSTTFQANNGITDIFLLPGIATSGISSSTNGAYAGKNITTQSIDGYVTIAYRKNARTGAGAIDKCETMLNSGSTALDYEPYGWAEKITCAGQTTPVYLGEVPTVRRVKKLVLTGAADEPVRGIGSNAPYTYYYEPTMPIGKTRYYVICSHVPFSWFYGRETPAIVMDPDCTKFYINFGKDIMDAQVSGNTENGFKEFCKNQYDSGNPVTIYYVLATTETAIVNEPLCKIGDYADELHSEDAGVSIPTVKGQNTLIVGTDLQPSEMTITYKG